MGIPFFFKWLRSQCRKAIVPVSASEKAERCDNLFIDVNGIIHTHFSVASENLDDNFSQIFHGLAQFILELVDLCGPTQLVFLALDGVPPKAKLNQQRSRRILSALERSAVHGLHSNAITPGTELMSRCREFLLRFLESQARGEWAHLRLVLSDASEPGEGEHKIFSFLRSLRSSPNYNPNQRHIVYGPDADLIVLGLSLHEPALSILREDPRPRATPYTKGRVLFLSGYQEQALAEDEALVRALCASSHVLQVHLVPKRASGLAYVEFDDKEASAEVCFTFTFLSHFSIAFLSPSTDW